MARGGRGRGGRRGANPDQSRGRGRGAFGGRGNGRGRGGGGPTYVTLDDFDYPIQQWPSSRGESNVSNGVRQMYGKPQNFNPAAPLSKQLYQSNILLKPIKFVRSVHTATLFTQTEEIFQPVVEAAVDGDERSHVPTADSVSRIFKAVPENVDHSSGGEEELEEFDFADIGKIQAAVDAGRAADGPVKASQTVEEQTAFFVDTTPMAIMSAARGHRIATNQLQGTFGEASDDDDVIVYVAPHPRHDRPSPAPAAPAEPVTPTFLPTTSIITGLPIGSAAPSTSYVPEVNDGPPAGQPPAFQLSLDTLFPEDASPVSEPSDTGVAPDAADLPPPPSFDNVTFAFDTTTPKKQTRRLHPVGTPRSLLKRSRKARRKPLRGFGSYGAMHEEALLHEVDPRRAEQRRGDSDVNWGDSDSDDGVEQLSTGVGDMEIDEGIDLAAMKKFVHSMSAEGSRHVTMDDVADMERMRQEDEEEPVRGAESAEEEEASASKTREGPTGSDDEPESESESESGDEEVDAIIRAGEAELIGESEEEDATRSGKAGRDQSGVGGEGSVEGQRSEEDEDEDDEESEEDEDDDEDDSDDEETPRRGFQARLERLRSNTSKGKGKARVKDLDDSSDEAMSVQMTWADEDEDFIDTIEALLLENQDILQSRNRKEKKKLFNAIRDGTFELENDKFADSMAPAKRAKDKDMPPELRGQWEKDRAKKAENKRKRALERIQLAADPLAQHKGGKKGRKTMLAAARADGDADLPNRVTDLVSLEQQIRRFLADIGGSNTMALPPANKQTRAQVHQLAMAFNLKSQSKGKGNTRYTTLTKTSKSGVGIQEGKIRRILREATGGTWQGPGGGGGKGRSKAMSLATHREGEEVGKEAPKIGASNMGFKMLAAMGWTDGDRIGLSGGLDAPLTAIMKKTKLGLGASMRS
ncbi:G-patch and R3H domain-containing protein C30B4.02c [Trametes pubescens]|uniref:G-patch and R3H domain-containing protein C30B4.02c n=1 Tax=Trametes pubescens TaxID=154538 RepID=A0A1M2W4V6_TRAPU|nr:G-patch and R3H domain-containing protein C30B4.02c [Trametes pubescens]